MVEQTGEHHHVEEVEEVAKECLEVPTEGSPWRRIASIAVYVLDTLVRLVGMCTLLLMMTILGMHLVLAHMVVQEVPTAIEEAKIMTTAIRPSLALAP
jgi:hypothetical protein